MTYQVGQVLYLVPKKGNVRVFPVQITEEIVKKTLHGEIVTYMVKVGSEEELVEIGRLDGELFASADSLKKALVERSTKALTQLVNQATDQARVWYNASPIVPDEHSQIHEPLDDELPSGVVTLSDGSRVKLPDSLK